MWFGMVTVTVIMLKKQSDTKVLMANEKMKVKRKSEGKSKKE